MRVVSKFVAVLASQLQYIVIHLRTVSRLHQYP